MWIPEVFWWWKNTSMGSPRSSQVDVPSLVAKVHHPLWRTPNWIVSHPALEAVLVGHAATIVRKNLPHHLQALCACLYFWGTPRPQALHLKPLKPQLSSCFDGRLFGGKCLLTKIHESIFRWSNHGKSMEIPTADGEICMSLLVTSSSMTMCIFILKSPKKKMTHYGLVNSPVFLCFLIPRFPFAHAANLVAHPGQDDTGVRIPRCWLLLMLSKQ